VHGELSPSHPESLPSVPPFLPVVLRALGSAEGNSDDDLFHTPRSEVHKAQRNIRGEKCSRYAGCFHQNVAIQHLLSQAASQRILFIFLSCGEAQHFAHPDHRVVSSSISSFRLRIMKLFAFKTCNKRNPHTTQRLPSIASTITPPSSILVSFSLNRRSPHAAQHVRRINGETSPEIQQLKHMLVYTKLFSSTDTLFICTFRCLKFKQCTTTPFHILGSPLAGLTPSRLRLPLRPVPPKFYRISRVSH